MKRIVMLAMVFVMVFSSVSFAGDKIGEYEMNCIVNQTYEICDLNKNASLGKWTDPDIFGNQYRLYIYAEDGSNKVVCVKHHASKEERTAVKAAKKAVKANK